MSASISRCSTRRRSPAPATPMLGVPNSLRGVVDLYDVTEDWAPIYDKTVLPGFYVAIGTSGNQFKNAPVVGKMMTKLIQECEAGRDHDAGRGFE